ncbi:MAG TPA: hypothetical protein VGR26_19005 [Acidimicrobiales bacterium]|nr:hypothetical protein [Acidimicrobiales bacterium]
MRPTTARFVPGSRPRRLVVVGVLLAAFGAAAVVLSAGDSPPAHRPTSAVASSTPSPPLTSSVITSPSPATTLPAYPQAELPPAALEPAPDTLPPRLDSLPALSPAQVADPEAVAARFLVTYATFDAGEDPAAHHARLAQFTTPALADELRRNSSASAALQELRARNVEFGGQVVEIAVSERSHSRATVAAVVEHTTAVDGVVDPEFRLVPYTVTLVVSERGWVVAGFSE